MNNHVLHNFSIIQISLLHSNFLFAYSSVLDSYFRFHIHGPWVNYVMSFVHALFFTNGDNTTIDIKLSGLKVRKAALYKCNIAGNPAVVTRLVDSMTDNLRATRAEATDVGNAVLDVNFFFPVETLEKWIVETKLSTMRPNAMNNYGVVLDDFGRLHSPYLKKWGGIDSFVSPDE
ncbi:hypothetical protein L2E82_38978 [Cichorium intybus]|uniref:Uncharacterized protein n=1 Tax=Cichorium intybus TaxID=13427 RepID=A0ACB9AGQ9_CICIN|nr:hypothetical protein L2E82_38978 [Cichorium intybus]